MLSREAAAFTAATFYTDTTNFTNSKPLTAGPNRIVNGSFEEHLTFDNFLINTLGFTTTGNNSTIEGRFRSYVSFSGNASFKGPANSQDPGAIQSYNGTANKTIVGAWSHARGFMRPNIGVIGMPNGWTTTTNLGNLSSNSTNPNNQPGNADGINGNFTVLAPNVSSIPNATVTDFDFHGRWTWFRDTTDSTGNASGSTHYPGQVDSTPRPVLLGHASMYFGLGAGQFGNLTTGAGITGYGDQTFGLVPETPNAGVVTLNATLAADNTFYNLHAIRAGGTGDGGTEGVSLAQAPDISQTLTNLTVNATYRMTFWVSSENNQRTVDAYNRPDGLLGIQLTGTGYNSNLTYNGSNEGHRIYLAAPGRNRTTTRGRFYALEFVARNATTTVTFRDYGHMETPTVTGTSANSTAETVLDGIELYEIEGTGAIGNQVWLDSNNDGLLNGAETGINGVTVLLDADLDGDGNYTASELGVATTNTTGNGTYNFTGLVARNYRVRIPTPPANATLSSTTTDTLDNQQNNDDNGIQAGGAGTEVLSPTIAIAAGETDNTIDFGFTALAAIGNQVWIDADNDGVRDVGESGAAGVTVQLQVDALGNGTFVPFGSNTTTNGTGNYAFTALPPGIYRVVIPTPPAGFPLSSTVTDLADNQQDNDDNGNQSVSGGSTTSPAITLSSGETDNTIDFGFVATAALGNQVWIDTNNNGLLDGAEVGVNGVAVQLFGDLLGNGTFVQVGANTTTAGNGTYGFTGLTPGITYQVRVPTPPANATLSSTTTNQTAGINNNDDGAQVGGAGTATTSGNIVLTAGQTDNTIDFGFVATAALGNQVWIDTNNNGLLDGAEVGVNGVAVQLFGDLLGNGTFVQVGANATTAGNGTYGFTGLTPGITYQVRVPTPPANATLSSTTTNQTAGINNNDDGAQVGGAGTATTSGNIVLTAGQTDNTIDFGFVATAALGNQVWIDTNNNGLLDGAEVGVNGVAVQLFGDLLGNGTFVQVGANATTAGNGTYGFTGLTPGLTYQVRVPTPPANATVSSSTTNQTAGINNNDDGAQAGGAGTATTSGNIVLTAGQTDNTIDFGFYATATVSGTVYVDNDNNDTGDVPLANVTLTLFSDPNGDGDPADGAPVGGNFVTGANGTYSFTGLVPGNYVVVQTQPAGYFTVTDGDTTTPGDDVANASALDNRIPVGLVSGETDTGNDFVEELPSAISGTVYEDTNNDDAGDVPIANVTLTLFSDPNGDGNPADGVQVGGNFVTGANGTYSFTNLAPGSYVVVQTQPAGYLDVTDLDSTADAGGSPVDAANTTTDNRMAATLAGGETDTGNDFVEERPATISGTVFVDTNNDDIGDTPLSNVTLTLFSDPNGDGNPADGSPVGANFTTGANGTYLFSGVVPGSYVVVQTQPAGYLTVTDGDTTTPGDDAPNASTLDNQIPVSVVSNENDTGNDFVEEQPAAIGNFVWIDLNNDGLYNGNETGSANVTVALERDLLGNGTFLPYGSNTTTNGTGFYNFTDLPPGIYRVVVPTPPAGAPASSAVTDTGDNQQDDDDNGIQAGGSGTATVSPSIALSPGETDNTVDFGFFAPGAISGTVRADITQPADNVGDLPIGNVTVTLFTDPNGDGDPADGVQVGSPTLTDPNGNYSFGGLLAGNYVVVETQPIGYINVNDGDSIADAGGSPADAPNSNSTDDRLAVSLGFGETDAGNDFLERDQCAAFFPDWQDRWNTALGNQTGPGQNPDGDVFPNLLEYAFCIPPDSGYTPTQPFCVRQNGTASSNGTVEAFLVRPYALTDVEYTMFVIDDLVNAPGGWVEVTGNMITPTISYNATNSKETVVWPNLASLPGLANGGFAILRVRLDGNDDGDYDDAGIDLTEWTEACGWQDTSMAGVCQTFSVPFVRHEIFTGTVDSVSGNTMNLATSANGRDLSTILDPARTYYIEVLDGAYEGHRFDLFAGGNNTLTVVADANIYGGSPFGTLAGLPANMTGNQIALRAHQTLADALPPSGGVGSNDSATADRVMMWNGTAWTTLWLFDNGGAPYWTTTANNSLANLNTTPVAPGEGLLVFRTLTGNSTLRTNGGVRENDFVRPLGAGLNFVGSMFPTDQSPAGNATRSMTAAGFTGGTNPSAMDQIQLWKADANPALTGYASYWLLSSGPHRYWVPWSSALTNQNNTYLFESSRAAFYRNAAPLPAYTVPSPW